MTNQMNYSVQPLLLLKRTLVGAGLAILLVSILIVIYGNEGNLIWIALLSTSIAGMGSGITYYLLNDLLQPGGLKRILAISFSLSFFSFSFWLALIFALAQVGLWD